MVEVVTVVSAFGPGAGRCEGTRTESPEGALRDRRAFTMRAGRWGAPGGGSWVRASSSLWFRSIRQAASAQRSKLLARSAGEPNWASECASWARPPATRRMLAGPCRVMSVSALTRREEDWVWRADATWATAWQMAGLAVVRWLWDRVPQLPSSMAAASNASRRPRMPRIIARRADRPTSGQRGAPRLATGMRDSWWCWWTKVLR